VWYNYEFRKVDKLCASLFNRISNSPEVEISLNLSKKSDNFNNRNDERYTISLYQASLYQSFFMLFLASVSIRTRVPRLIPRSPPLPEENLPLAVPYSPVPSLPLEWPGLRTHARERATLKIVIRRRTAEAEKRKSLSFSLSFLLFSGACFR